MPQPAYMLRLVLQRIGGNNDELMSDWPLIFHLDEDEANIITQCQITRAVTTRLWLKQIAGAKEHRFVMQAGDGRVDALKEAQAEALDLCQYLEKAIMEMPEKWPEQQDK